MRPISPIILVALLAPVAADPPTKRQADQAALKPFGGLVGEWKGTGMPQRGSAGDRGWKRATGRGSSPPIRPRWN